MYIPLSPFFRKASSFSLRFYFHRLKKDGQDFLPILFVQGIDLIYWR